MVEENTVYGIMYGVKRTTIYLPEDMKAAIEREATRCGVTEAEVIREAVSAHLGPSRKRRVIVPAIPEGLGENMASRTDEVLEELAGEGP